MIFINTILKKNCMCILIFILILFSVFSFNVKADEYMKDMKTNKERSMNTVKGLEVDSEGKIYISTWAGINVYNNSGEFLYGLQVDTSGAYDMMFDDNGNLNVAIAKKESTYIYNRDGMLIDIIEDKGNDIYYYYDKNRKVKMDDKGNKYRLINSNGCTKVTKTAPDGTVSIIIQDPVIESSNKVLLNLIFAIVLIIIVYIKIKHPKRIKTKFK